MTNSFADGMVILLAIILIVVAVWKWRIVQDWRSILSVIGNALRDSGALGAGLLLAALYLVVFMILGGKGGRIHILFGRWILNATPEEIASGLVLAILLMISTALFVYGVRTIGSMQSKRNGRIGFFGAMLALLAALCP